MPNAQDAIQAIDSVTDDLTWEVTSIETNRNAAIHGEVIFDTDHDPRRRDRRRAWGTEILDDIMNPANQTSGPIVAGGRCTPDGAAPLRGEPDGCGHHRPRRRDRREAEPAAARHAPGEPGGETWGDVPFQERRHVGWWTMPSVGPDLSLVYVGTSVTPSAPKFLLGGSPLAHLVPNSTLALNAAT